MPAELIFIYRLAFSIGGNRDGRLLKYIDCVQGQGDDSVLKPSVYLVAGNPLPRLTYNIL